MSTSVTAIKRSSIEFLGELALFGIKIIKAKQIEKISNLIF